MRLTLREQIERLSSEVIEWVGAISGVFVLAGLAFGLYEKLWP